MLVFSIIIYYGDTINKRKETEETSKTSILLATPTGIEPAPTERQSVILDH